MTDLIIRKIQKATARQVGEVLHAKGQVGSIESGDATARKVLNDMVTNGELKKEGSCYMLSHLTGYGKHDKLLTEALIKIAKMHEIEIYREHSIEEVGLRPDAIILIKKELKGACVILEVMNEEKTEYLMQKKHTWEGWKNALPYLTGLFGVNVKSFIFSTYGESVSGVFEFEHLLVRLK